MTDPLLHAFSCAFRREAVALPFDLMEFKRETDADAFWYDKPRFVVDVRFRDGGRWQGYRVIPGDAPESEEMAECLGAMLGRALAMSAAAPSTRRTRGPG